MTRGLRRLVVRSAARRGQRRSTGDALPAGGTDLRVIFDALPSMIGYWDAALTCRFANRAYMRWFGVEPHRLYGCHIRELLGERLYAANQPYIAGALRGEPQVFERSIPHPNGSGLRHSLAHYLPDVADGQVRGFYALVHDVTDLTISRRRLAASEAFLERAGRLASVGGWRIDLESGEVTWTSETLRLLDISPGLQPSLGAMLDLYDREARPCVAAAIDGLRARGGSFDLELPLTTATGRPLWVRTIGEAELAGDPPRPVLLIGAIQDVTARHAADTALREAMRVTEAASTAKSGFLANMSHEIRTPLHAILGMTHLLTRSRLDDEQRRFVGAIEVAGRGLLGIVDDVLDLAKIEAGGLALDVAGFDLRAALADVIAVLTPQAHAKRLELALETAADLPSVVEGDALRVRQILLNLVGNGIKFTAEGSVRLAAVVEEQRGRDLCVRFTVRDTGIGIPPDVQSALFAPFVQADVSTTRRFGGTGLGLSIVRGLVEQMGGEVGVCSEVGRGSEFWATVRLALPPRAVREADRLPAHDGAGPRLAAVRVLVVDDNEFNREVAARILEQEGAVVTSATDGVEVLEILRVAPDAYDIVLMDVQMPRLDGNAATTAIRHSLGLVDLPILGLTAGALVAERRRALDAGMTGFITKPLHPDDLVRIIRGHVDRRPGA